ncbi:sarcosine oxidase subunit gamma [Castellaniella defragrans]|jgi:sarcosine oxidase subunit gamma|uniref:Sarcosine oxidase gamma subunit n=2 Tax=Castellaniella TaxID=359336 RepID=W8X917_CASD6|nr:sarcosine oxidase subunit gamma family protein [Castellaniella defragrans]CDM24045.1 Sarcosine oxidase gamma subunit [Castellaniella defragrans 65Phen]
MLNENKQQSPLTGLHTDFGLPLLHGDSNRVSLSEQSLVSLANLRVDPSNSTILGTVQACLGLELPLVPNTVAHDGDITALWLAPDEWLLRAGAGVDLVSRVEHALAGHWFAITDQSSGYSAVQLHGPGARNVLNAGCPLDLHPRALPLGRCAQSHFFKASVLLRPLEDTGDAWELIVRRSFADYAVRMLLDAMEG